jgi:signal transduction histidine kinase
VKDEGIGISLQDLPKLFERYYRVEEVKETTIAGFGIGLYLSWEIIRRHSGDIWVESKLGKGSTFYFTLPIAS